MKRRLLVGAVVAAAWSVMSAAVVSAHGDHDARVLARDLEAGPHRISLWQVYPDVGDAMTPHLIVMFDGVPAAPADINVRVVVDSTPMDVRPSTTTPNGWETTDGVAEGDVVSVAISDGTGAWALDPVVVPPPPTSMIPMTELIYVSIFLTAATAVWVARRTTRAWRRPTVVPSVAT
jgi:hypothetical protein